MLLRQKRFLRFDDVRQIVGRRDKRPDFVPLDIPNEIAEHLMFENHAPDQPKVLQI